jgi:hypothetical protein
LWCEITTGTQLAPDAEALVERIEDVLALVAHVRAVDAVALRQGPADLDHLLARRGARRLVVQPGRHADRARRQRLVHHRAHGFNFLLARGPVHVVHGLDAQHGMADEQRAVGGRRLRLQRLDILLERLEAKPAALVVQQIDRHGDRGLHSLRRRRERDAAVAGDHRGDALAHLRRHVGRREHQPVVVRMRVDEARRGDLAGRIDFFFCPAAEGPYFGDLACADGDVGLEARRARSVDDGRVADD